MSAHPHPTIKRISEEAPKPDAVFPITVTPTTPSAARAPAPEGREGTPRRTKAVLEAMQGGRYQTDENHPLYVLADELESSVADLQSREAELRQAWNTREPQLYAAERTVEDIRAQLASLQKEMAESKEQWRMSSVCRELTAQLTTLKQAGAELAYSVAMAATFLKSRLPGNENMLVAPLYTIAQIEEAQRTALQNWQALAAQQGFGGEEAK